MPKLTKRFVENIRPAGKDVVLWDQNMPGFGLRVQPSGIRSYVVQYRNAQRRSRRLTIGKHGVVTAERAREIARQILNSVHDHKDPRDPVAERRALINAPTVNHLLDQYIAEHVQKRNRRRTQEEVKRLIERHIRRQLGKYKVASVTRQDMAKLHSSLMGTPRQANFVLAICSKVFGLAEVWNMRPDGSNPCRRIERYPENHRERFLSAEELAVQGRPSRSADCKIAPSRPGGRDARIKCAPVLGVKLIALSELLR
jgi:hypothetical protein